VAAQFLTGRAGVGVPLDVMAEVGTLEGAVAAGGLVEDRDVWVTARNC
jgi:hypothetical protein